MVTGRSANISSQTELYAVPWQLSQMKSETVRALLGERRESGVQEKRAEAHQPACSELKLEGQLRRERAADFIQRIEAAILAAAS